jgi:hypothetical protein
MSNFHRQLRVQPRGVDIDPLRMGELLELLLLATIRHVVTDLITRASVFWKGGGGEGSKRAREMPSNGMYTAHHQLL